MNTKTVQFLDAIYVRRASRETYWDQRELDVGQAIVQNVVTVSDIRMLEIRFTSLTGDGKDCDIPMSTRKVGSIVIDVSVNLFFTRLTFSLVLQEVMNWPECMTACFDTDVIPGEIVVPDTSRSHRVHKRRSHEGSHTPRKTKSAAESVVGADSLNRPADKLISGIRTTVHGEPSMEVTTGKSIFF